jgi:hypothetical protein
LGTIGRKHYSGDADLSNFVANQQSAHLPATGFEYHDVSIGCDGKIFVTQRDRGGEEI